MNVCRSTVVLLVLLACASPRPPAPAHDAAPSGVAEVVARTLRVVSVRADGTAWGCSGVPFADGRVFATAAHCVDSGGSLVVRNAFGGESHVYGWEQPDAARDLAYGTTERAFDPVALEPTNNALVARERLWTVGWGCDGWPRAHESGELDLTRGAEWRTLTSDPPCLGDSGGPVVNAAGRVVGVVTHTSPSHAYGVRLLEWP